MALLTEPPSISAETVYKDTENPGTPQRLPPCRAPKNQRPATDVTTEAGPGPSGLTVTGYAKLVSGEDLLVLPPLPRDVFDELMTMFDGNADSLTEPETSDEEVKRRKFGRDTICGE